MSTDTLLEACELICSLATEIRDLNDQLQGLRNRYTDVKQDYERVCRANTHLAKELASRQGEAYETPNPPDMPEIEMPTFHDSQSP